MAFMSDVQTARPAELLFKRHAAAKTQSGGPRDVSDAPNLHQQLGQGRTVRRKADLRVLWLCSRMLDWNGGGDGGCVRTPCKKSGEDRSPPGVTDGLCTLGRSLCPLAPALSHLLSMTALHSAGGASGEGAPTVQV
jgi:hypothetical protein